jgi:hypothetical protein
MEGPVLSGGVAVLISVFLWLVYLVPSWRRRREYDSVERNAVRLNQALRVLAETTEIPDEVRVELSARTAHAQQKLAKRVQAEKEASELELLKAELAATRLDPAVRQARARRRMRLFATLMLLAGLVAVAFGVWQLVTVGAQLWLWAGGVAAVVALMVLQRMATVAARAARRIEDVVSARRRVAPPLHDQGPATWTPREVPAPLATVAGSRAQVAQLSAEAERARREAARQEELRRRAERMAPPAPVVLPKPAPAKAPAAASGPDFSKMGYVDDAEIEAHVRQLLAGRAAG